MMKLLSVNVSRPQEIEHEGSIVRTAIFKRPRPGRVALGPTSLDGDGQADLKDHGGTHKAVYAYPFEHYAYWSGELSRTLSEYGQFGENLTVSGLREDALGIGDILGIGSARLQVAQPRKPCFKLGIRMGLATFPKLFLASGRLGFYLRVVRQGELGAGDEIRLEQHGAYGLTIADLWRIVFVDKDDLEGARRALEIPWLAEEFRKPLTRRLEAAG